MKTLIIQDGETKKEIDYSGLNDEYIDNRIRRYEQKYGRLFQDFYNGFDSDEAGMDELTDLLDWENLVEEKKARAEKTAYKIPERT